MWGFSLIDPELGSAMQNELKRQQESLSLIASENYVSINSMLIQGSFLTNKVVEGYPGRRFHGGCEFIDIIENLAIERAKELYGAEHANVQPHSGVNANLAVYAAVLKKGDTILSLDLAHGGHLSHGSLASFTGYLYKGIYYGVDRETECLNYDEIRKMALAYRPKIIIAGGSAYSRAIDFGKFREISDEVGAFFLADIAHYAGLVAAGLYPSPVPFADFVTATGFKTLRGAKGAFILCKKKYANLIDKAVFPGTQGSAIFSNIAAKAYNFKQAATDAFRQYSESVIENARTLMEEMKGQGYRIIAGSTDCHLFLVDVSHKGITGSEAETALEKAGIAVNKNLIPFDSRTSLVTSGIRIGTQAVTARGLTKKEMIIIAKLMNMVLSSPKESVILSAREEVKQICIKYPLYQDIWETC